MQKFNYPFGSANKPEPKKAKPMPMQGDDEMGEEDVDPSDKPVMTEHHGDGTHTTHHESGAKKHHASADELLDHLKQHEPEEEEEIADEHSGGKGNRY